MRSFPPREHDGPPSNRGATAAHAYPFLFTDEDREEALRTRAVSDARFLNRGEPRTPEEGVVAGRQVVEDLLAGKLLDAAIGPSDRPKKGSLLRCVTREEVAYASPLADAILAVTGLGSHPLAVARRDARELLEARRGAAVFGFAVTEPDAGSDVSRISVKASRAGGGWRITGTKVFISNAGIATHYTVFARTAEGKKGVSCFLVEAARVRTELLDLNAPHPVGVLHFEDTPGVLLGEEGQGTALALGTLDVFRPSVGAAAIGMGRRALDEAMLHAASRVQFGAPLIENAQVQALLADAATALEAARALVYRAAWKNDHLVDAGGSAPGHPVKATLESAMGKLAATEAAQKAVDLAVQLSGGLGVIRGRTVEQLYRAVRALRIYEGASEVMRLVIARELRGGSGAQRPPGEAREKP